MAGSQRFAIFEAETDIIIENLIYVMYSNLFRFIFSMTGLAPIFLSCWIVKLIQEIEGWSFYLSLDSFSDFCLGLVELLSNHYLLLLFILLVLLCNLLLNKAIRTLPIGSINVKHIKPVDTNLSSILFSYVLPWFKFLKIELADWILLTGTIMVYFAIVIIWQNSYHYNLIVRLLLGYRHYEIKTTSEVSYLLLAKYKIVNPKQINRYVQLYDYMIIDKSNS